MLLKALSYLTIPKILEIIRKIREKSNYLICEGFREIKLETFSKNQNQIKTIIR